MSSALDNWSVEGVSTGLDSVSGCPVDWTIGLLRGYPHWAGQCEWVSSGLDYWTVEGVSALGWTV